MRFFGLFSALVVLTLTVSVTGCLGGDDTSVAPPPVVDAGPDATAPKEDAGSTPTPEADGGSDPSPADAGTTSDANPFG